MIPQKLSRKQQLTLYRQSPRQLLRSLPAISQTYLSLIVTFLVQFPGPIQELVRIWFTNFLIYLNSLNHVRRLETVPLVPQCFILKKGNTCSFPWDIPAAKSRSKPGENPKKDLTAVLADADGLQPSTFSFLNPIFSSTWHMSRK